MAWTRARPGQVPTSQVRLEHQRTLIPHELDFWREVNRGMKNDLSWPQARTEGLRDRCSGGRGIRRAMERNRGERMRWPWFGGRSISRSCQPSQRWCWVGSQTYNSGFQGSGIRFGGGAQGGLGTWTAGHLWDWLRSPRGEAPPASFSAHLPPTPCWFSARTALCSSAACVWCAALCSARPRRGWQAQCLPPRQSVCLHDSLAALCTMG